MKNPLVRNRVILLAAIALVIDGIFFLGHMAALKGMIAAGKDVQANVTLYGVLGGIFMGLGIGLLIYSIMELRNRSDTMVKKNAADVSVFEDDVKYLGVGCIVLAFAVFVVVATFIDQDGTPSRSLSNLCQELSMSFILMGFLLLVRTGYFRASRKYLFGAVLVCLAPGLAWFGLLELTLDVYVIVNWVLLACFILGIVLIHRGKKEARA